MHPGTVLAREKSIPEAVPGDVRDSSAGLGVARVAHFDNCNL